MHAQEVITSVHNRKVKEWASLLDKKGRDQTGCFLVEGPHLVQEALKSGAPVRTVVYEQDAGIPAELLPWRDSTRWIAASPEVLRKCSDTVHPQGVFAVVEKTDVPADVLFERPNAFGIVTDGVQDPGNLGTIIRSADAAGADFVVLGKGTADLYNPKTVRATMGSLFHLPIVHGDLAELLSIARDRGIRTVAAALDAAQSCYALDCRQAVWFVVGNEAHGVSPAVRRLVTDEVVIPMRGGAESLNVAMAATILLFEAMRQRLEMGRDEQEEHFCC
jgi:TrmH family RNA methyltransferase